MSIDIRQFHAGFFEESLEGLSIMEGGLLALESGQASEETLHAIFRAAHSIKGGAGSFGFARISEATHHLETLLDELRAGHRSADADVLKVLYQSVDGVRAMITAAQAEQPCPEAQVQAFEAALKVVLGKAPVADASAEPAAVAAPRTTLKTWQIHFAPTPGLLATGNEPLLLMQALAELGELQGQLIEPQGEDVALETLSVDDCRLAWDLTLTTDASEAVIRDVFSWVDDCCKLRITELAPVVAAVIAPQPEAAAGPLAMVKKPVAAAATAAAQIPTASIRVGVDKVDALIDLVGELVITQAMLHQAVAGLDPVQFERLHSMLEQLERNTRSLQSSVLAVRMLPVGTVFSRFPRVVRDLADKLGKRVKLVLEGEATELDKGMIERITDPLMHLLRNALDHGLETIEERRAVGKPEECRLKLSARHASGSIILEIEDDGRGLNREKILAKALERGVITERPATDADIDNLIFEPGFSTADVVTDVSGRGVGMDVVRKNVAALGGRIELSSTPGVGTRVSVRLPLTLAILDGMSVAVGDEVFIVPIASVMESFQPTPGQMPPIGGEQRLVKVRDNYLPLIRLSEHFGLPTAYQGPGIAVVVEADGRRLALMVDALVGQQQVVIKSLEQNYRTVAGVAGATILGDGRVALILDVARLTAVSALAIAA
ncbi:chemotaxis protein CheA [Polycyclovorans algicola]|uniref:chemotaxis protein CheA n=1 Tax=Polycyclovorans algicola TaxID=616992 RepID=UPI0004A6CEDD|nr:chemotaxis protein CheA [Polycyclovorans algicola]